MYCSVCVRVVFVMCLSVSCDLLCDVVWLACSRLFVFVRFFMCQCDVFVMYCVLLNGVCLRLCAWAWEFNVFVCLVCELLCAVLWCVSFVVFVRVLCVRVCCVWCSV